MNAQSSTRFALPLTIQNQNQLNANLNENPDEKDLKKRERRKIGKRLEKAQLMLEAAYLNQAVNGQKLKHRMAVTSRGVRRLRASHKGQGNQGQQEGQKGLHSIPEKVNFAMSLSTGDIDDLRCHQYQNQSRFQLHCQCYIDQDDIDQDEDDIEIANAMKSSTRPINGSRLLRSTRQIQSSRDVMNRNHNHGRRKNLNTKSKKRFQLFRRNLKSYKTRGNDHDCTNNDGTNDMCFERRQMERIGKCSSYTNLVQNEPGGNKFRFLHAVLTLHFFLPEAAYDFAIVHYRDQVYETEEKTGNLPLHIAASMKAQSDFNRNVIFTELLDLNKSAIQIKNKAGQLLLHIALSNDDQCEYETIVQLLNADPWASRIMDDETDLYPFELAALKKRNVGVSGGGSMSSIDQLSTIYTLLLEAPENIGAAIINYERSF